jgi:hypothetical protein
VDLASIQAVIGKETWTVEVQIWAVLSSINQRWFLREICLLILWLLHRGIFFTLPCICRRSDLYLFVNRQRGNVFGNQEGVWVNGKDKRIKNDEPIKPRLSAARRPKITPLGFASSSP